MLPAVHIVLPSVHTSLATILCWHHGWQCRPESVIGSHHGAQCTMNVYVYTVQMLGQFKGMAPLCELAHRAGSR